jgi:hypothetical protein
LNNMNSPVSFKSTLLASALTLALFGAAAAHATNGNNGNGGGGCGNGQTTNGCPGNGGNGGSGGAGGSGGDSTGVGLGVGVGLGGAGGDAAANAAAAAAAQAAAQAAAISGAAAINGPNTNQNANTATGGAATSTGTNVGINGQQQGIDRSGNSTNTVGQNTDVRNTLGQATDVRNNNSVAGANTGTNTSANSLQGGAQNASTQSGVKGSGNATVAVDARQAGDVYNSKTTVWAPVVHGPAAAPLAAANLVVIPGVCGPRVEVIKTPVVGKRFGIFGGQDDVEQGYDYEVVPAAVPYKIVGGEQHGEVVTFLAAALGTSSAGSFSIGGYGKDGNGGQGGAAASGQLQQIVTRVLRRDCVMARAVEPAPIAIPGLPTVSKVGE